MSDPRDTNDPPSSAAGGGRSRRGLTVPDILYPGTTRGRRARFVMEWHGEAPVSIRPELARHQGREQNQGDHLDGLPGRAGSNGIGHCRVGWGRGRPMVE